MSDPRDFRVLTVRQPWASLLVEGLKEYETRTRCTHWRGWVAIQAGKAMNPEQRQLAATFPGRADPELGRVVGFVRLVDCFQTDSDADHPDGDIVAAKWGKGVTDDERRLGDYSPGRFAWRMADAVAFRGPTLKGKLGLWKPTAHQHAQIFASYLKHQTNPTP